MELLESQHQKFSAQARNAIQAEQKATSDFAEAQSRLENAERALKKCVQELEAEAAQLRQDLETRADATQVRIDECGESNVAKFQFGGFPVL